MEFLASSDVLESVSASQSSQARWDLTIPSLHCRGQAFSSIAWLGKIVVLRAAAARVGLTRKQGTWRSVIRTMRGSLKAWRLFLVRP